MTHCHEYAPKKHMDFAILNSAVVGVHLAADMKCQLIAKHYAVKEYIIVYSIQRFLIELLMCDST